MDENKQDIEILHTRVDYTNVEVEQIGELQEKVEVNKCIIHIFQPKPISPLLQLSPSVSRISSLCNKNVLTPISRLSRQWIQTRTALPR